MLARRIAVPLSVPTVAGTAAVVGVLHADAAVAAACSVTYTVGSQWNSGFTGDLVARGWLAKSKYLSSVQAGPEILTGSGRLDTTVTIG